VAPARYGAFEDINHKLCYYTYSSDQAEEIRNWGALPSRDTKRDGKNSATDRGILDGLVAYIAIVEWRKAGL
jgi:hypothetical protein